MTLNTPDVAHRLAVLHKLIDELAEHQTQVADCVSRLETEWFHLSAIVESTPTTGSSVGASDAYLCRKLRSLLAPDDSSVVYAAAARIEQLAAEVKRLGLGENGFREVIRIREDECERLRNALRELDQ